MSTSEKERADLFGGGLATPTPLPTRVTDTGVTVDIDCTAQTTVPSNGSVNVSTTNECDDSIRVTAPDDSLPPRDNVLVSVVEDNEELMEQTLTSCGETLLRGFVAQLRDSRGRVLTEAFDAPATVFVTIAVGTLPAGATSSNVILAYWDGEQWVDTGAEATVSTNGAITFTTESEHFTIFGALYQAGEGTFLAAPAFSPVGQALVIFGGGSVDQLASAMSTACVRGVWVQDAGGTFSLLVLGGPAFLNEEFQGRFPDGLPCLTAMTLVR